MKISLNEMVLKCHFTALLFTRSKTKLVQKQSDCDVYINDKIIPFKTGDLIIVNSGENHALTFERADAHYIVIKVLPEILYSNDKSLFELKYMIPFIIQDSNNKRYFSSKEIGGRYIRDVMTDIMNEWSAENYGYEIAIRSNVLKII